MRCLSQTPPSCPHILSRHSVAQLYSQHSGDGDRRIILETRVDWLHSEDYSVSKKLCMFSHECAMKLKDSKSKQQEIICPVKILPQLVFLWDSPTYWCLSRKFSMSGQADVHVYLKYKWECAIILKSIPSFQKPVHIGPTYSFRQRRSIPWCDSNRLTLTQCLCMFVQSLGRLCK